MLVYRLTKGKYKNDLSGTGASVLGARWNSLGVKILYTSSSIALAMAEVLVHLSISEFPNEPYYILTIQLPSNFTMKSVLPNTLNSNWNNLIDEMEETKTIGDNFIFESKHCVLKVPSAVVAGDYNYLINPANKCFSKIKVINEMPFPFDNRLFE